MNIQPCRLQPGDDLRAALDAILAASGEQAAFVLAGIGSLGDVRLRLAGADEAEAMSGEFEILTLSGSLSPDGSHLHMSISDAQGRVRGGHVSPGCIVRTTAEVMVGFLPDLIFRRLADPRTGYAELAVMQRTTG